MMLVTSGLLASMLGLLMGPGCAVSRPGSSTANPADTSSAGGSPHPISPKERTTADTSGEDPAASLSFSESPKDLTSGKRRSKKSPGSAVANDARAAEAYAKPEKKESAPGPGTIKAAPAPVQAPALRAGRHDDNKQFNYFVSFLQENKRYVVYPAAIDERLIVDVQDKAGRSLPNCAVELRSPGEDVWARATTYADGRTMFLPGELNEAARAQNDYVVRARCNGKIRNGQLSRKGRRLTEVRFPTARILPQRTPVDIAIVLDTTGSMQSQIDRLTKTLRAIHVQLSHLASQPDIRFSLVAYRDRGDAYVTQVTPFTANIDVFQAVLDGLEADGGGDTPEDLQAGLEKAMHTLQWRSDAVRIGFVVADAVPHTDYGQTYNYRDAMRESLQRGIKWVTVGAGGLGRDGEVIFRQLAQYTMGEYVFITQGDVGDHEGGTGEASHHVGSNYHVENLDQAIVRIVRRELSYLTDSPREIDGTIVAQNSEGLSRDAILAPVAAEVIRQLADYSALRLEEHTPVAVLPVGVVDAKGTDVAEYFTDQLILSATRNRYFRVVERDLRSGGAGDKNSAQRFIRCHRRNAAWENGRSGPFDCF
ncbi:MAG: vWA domain-containing protein [Myxococcota bacterium]